MDGGIWPLCLIFWDMFTLVNKGLVLQQTFVSCVRRVTQLTNKQTNTKLSVSKSVGPELWRLRSSIHLSTHPSIHPVFNFFVIHQSNLTGCLLCMKHSINRPNRIGMRMGHRARSRELSYSLFPSPQSRILELLVSMRNEDLVLVGRL